jgi:ABC-type phosphate transport system substrate-binding protein
VLAIDGIDPAENAAAVYDGSYALSRRIHLIIPDEPSAEASQLAAFLLSPQGQALIAQAGYLPLPEGSAG